MRKIFFFLLPLIFSLQSPPKVFAVVQKWPVKLHSNSSVSLEGGENNNILFDSDVTTIYNKLTVYADADFDFSTEFELAANALNELEVEVAEGGGFTMLTPGGRGEEKEKKIKNKKIFVFLLDNVKEQNSFTKFAR